MTSQQDVKTYFWPYDIFGYLLPGVIALAPLIEFHSGVRAIFEARYQPESIADNLVLLVGVYVIGHIVSAASSFLLERCFLRLTFGYPLNQFLCGRFAGTSGRQLAIRIANIGRWRVFRSLPRSGKRGVMRKGIEFLGDWAERRLDLLPGFCHPFDPRIVKLIQQRFDQKFGVVFRNWSVRRRTHDITGPYGLTLRRICPLRIGQACTSWNFTAFVATPVSHSSSWGCIHSARSGRPRR